MMKISIITSVYNTEKYLHECLDSVINQTNQNYELIIINDGSKDNSIKIIKEYAKNNNKIIVIDKENTGLADSRNIGLDKASGDYALFLDSDDYLNKDAINIMINNISANPADIYLYESTRFDEINKKDDVYRPLFLKMPDYVNLNKNPILCKIIRSAPILYCKNIYKKVRFIKGKIHEDNYFCLSAYSKANKIFIARTCIYNVRTRSDFSSITQNLSYKTFLDVYEQTLKIDLEIKNKKLVKYHLNSLMSYNNKHVKEPMQKSQANNLINKYLKEMKNNKIISKIKYIYLIIYKKIKY